MELEELKNKYSELSLEEVIKKLDDKIINIAALEDEIKTLSILTNAPHPFKTLSIEYCVLYDIAREKGFNESELKKYAEKYFYTTSKLLNSIN